MTEAKTYKVKVDGLPEFSISAMDESDFARTLSRDKRLMDLDENTWIVYQRPNGTSERITVADAKRNPK